MHYVGIWERNEGITAVVARRAEKIHLLTGRHPAEFAETPLDLLVIGPEAVGWAGAGAVDCHTVLLPGTAGPLARALKSRCAVSYGTSPKDTLTFSSLEGDQICLAVQRELITLDGAVVEQQELILPFPPGLPSQSFLAIAGTLLIMGFSPETMRRLFVL